MPLLTAHATIDTKAHTPQGPRKPVTITTLAFALNAQCVIGHLVQNNEARAQALLLEMTDEQLRSLQHVAGTLAHLSAAERAARAASQ